MTGINVAFNVRNRKAPKKFLFALWNLDTGKIQFFPLFSPTYLIRTREEKFQDIFFPSPSPPALFSPQLSIGQLTFKRPWGNALGSGRKLQNFSNTAFPKS